MRFQTHHTGIVLEVQENTICSSPRLALAHDNRRHDLLSEFRLSLLHSCHNHITNTTGRQTVETSSNTLNGDNVEISCAGVVAAIHDGTAADLLVTIFPGCVSDRVEERAFQLDFRGRNIHWESECHLQLATRGTTAIGRNCQSWNRSRLHAIDLRLQQLQKGTTLEIGKHIRDLCHFDDGFLRRWELSKRFLWRRFVVDLSRGAISTPKLIRVFDSLKFYCHAEV